MKNKAAGKILLIDTTASDNSRTIQNALERRLSADSYEYINTAGLTISHCHGCNYCWLKTPGECMIRDDFNPLLKKMSEASQIWLISDTSFGFVSHQTKNIIDRYMPLMTMYLHFSKKQMRHVPRYANHPDFGIIWFGDGNKAYLTQWCERVAVNFAGRSLGAFSGESYEEAISCMC